MRLERPFLLRVFHLWMRPLASREFLAVVCSVYAHILNGKMRFPAIKPHHAMEESLHIRRFPWAYRVPGFTRAF